MTEVRGTMNDWQGILHGTCNDENGNNIKSVVRRLTLAACVYHIWLERNNRIFNDSKKSSVEIFKSIMDVIRNKLSGITVKDSKGVRDVEKEIEVEWGKGLAQRREGEAELEELELQKTKPFARTRHDPDLERMLKDRVRWDDPMMHFVKRKNSEMVFPDIGDNEKMKESGFIAPQEAPKQSWLKRGLDAAPNRYGIRPGRHWDGVDRSNGFEKNVFSVQNEKQATEREAYLWSVSDM